ncbi:MAG: tyrosine-type recombinase/integrase [bacterium]|nr:tyrosine-type recombinase/integrase [bacterium]
MKPTDFAKALSHYLGIYLPGQRNVSTNTIKSYRDTFKLLLLYCQQSNHRSVDRLCLKDIDKSLVLGFLDWLEQQRHNGISTRNQRLACIHGFYRYMHIEDPTGLLQYQQILSIPSKKAPAAVVSHLTPEALKLILTQPNTLTSSGRRDLALLSTLYDTGARVQELIDLRVRDLRFDPPAIITLTGKGRKKRQVPLSSNTELLLKHYVSEAFGEMAGVDDQPLFYNRMHTKMTRTGIAYILNKYAQKARKISTIVPTKVNPHLMRHTKAMLLLQAGVNLIYIRDFLGHVDIATTEVYARADTEMKRHALEKAYPDIVDNTLPHWTKDGDLLSWLSTL